MINSTCKDAVETYGIESQIGQLHEEVGELLAAINQCRRGRCTKLDVCTEIADVMIMCEQMAYIYGEEETMKEVGRKIVRLKSRIKKEKTQC